MHPTPARLLTFCALAAAAGLTAAGCASAPTPEVPAAQAADAAVTGTPADWQAAVCRDGADRHSGTRHTVQGRSCVPADGDGIVHFDHFESAPAMESVLSWTPSPYVATTVVDGHPVAIWTPSGEESDLAPLGEFGFQVVSYRSAALQRADDVPATVPSGQAVDLPANEFGYVVVQTASGDTQCIVEAAFVGCQTDGTGWPQHADGSGPYHGVRINADGTGSYVDGNLGAAEPTTVAGQTYRAIGWTITSTPTGLRFANDRTGHGAVVGTDRVAPF